MNGSRTDRRRFLALGAGATLVTAAGLSIPARAAGLPPTPTMRGGANNYRAGAAIMERIGGGGFTMEGRVRRAGDGAPLAGRRIQMWAHTTEGHERDWESHGATLTNEDGLFVMDMPQIVPAFGQAHGHLAYDADEDAAFGGGGFETVFLRPLMSSPNDKTLFVDFVLTPA
ncbi:MAG: Twin-arginine translocation pathway signal [Pseudomonadota bacterium]